MRSPTASDLCRQADRDSIHSRVPPHPGRRARDGAVVALTTPTRVDLLLKNRGIRQPATAVPHSGTFPGSTPANRLSSSPLPGERSVTQGRPAAFAAGRRSLPRERRDHRKDCRLSEAARRNGTRHLRFQRDAPLFRLIPPRSKGQDDARLSSARRCALSTPCWRPSVVRSGSGSTDHAFEGCSALAVVFARRAASVRPPHHPR